MRRLIPPYVVLGCVLVACDSAPDAPTASKGQRLRRPAAVAVAPRESGRMTLSPAAAALNLPPVQAIELSPEEEHLVAQLESLYTGDPRRAGFRASLTDPRVGKMRISGNPRAQKILDQLYELRESNANRAWAAAQAAPKARAALVVLVDRLSDPTATAMILRRPGEPSDVIALPPGKLTVPAFGAAIRALVRVRRETGDIPRQAMQIMVHGENVPASWSGSNLNDGAVADLQALRSATKREVKGLGQVRAITIHVLGSASP